MEAYICAALMFLCVLMQVKMLVQSENGKLRAALVANLKSAVTASFLMLPESFSEEDLFLQIAGLSYAGTSLFTTTETWRKIYRKEEDDPQYTALLFSLTD